MKNQLFLLMLGLSNLSLQSSSELDSLEPQGPIKYQVPNIAKLRKTVAPVYFREHVSNLLASAARVQRGIRELIDTNKRYIEAEPDRIEELKAQLERALQASVLFEKDGTTVRPEFQEIMGKDAASIRERFKNYIQTKEKRLAEAKRDLDNYRKDIGSLEVIIGNLSRALAS